MKKIANIIKAYLLATTIFFSLMAITVFIIMFTNFKESWGCYAAIGIFSFSALVFGILVGRTIGRKGLIVGIASSVAYIAMFSLVLLYSFETNLLDVYKNILWLLPIICCSIGGIIGTNSNN